MSPHFCKDGRKERKMEKFVGIDIAKETFDICINPSGETLHVA